MSNIYKTDLDCIQDVKENNSEESLKTLIQRHSGIYLDIIHKMMPVNHNSIAKRELISEKDSFIYQCALSFDPSIKIKFSTYIGNQAKWRCLNVYNVSRRRKTDSMEVTNEPSQPSDILESVEKNEAMSFVENVLRNYPDPRAIKIFQMRYKVGKNNKVMPWRNIAKKLDLSIQGCINIHDKLLKSIKQVYEQSHP